MEVYYGIIISIDKYYENIARNFWAEPVRDPLRDFIYAIHEDNNIRLTGLDIKQIDKYPAMFLVKNPYDIDFLPQYQYLKTLPINDDNSLLIGYPLDVEDYKILPLEEVLTPEIKAKVDRELKDNDFSHLPDIYLFKVTSRGKLRYINDK